jgi:hypothetical protein
MIKDFVNMYDYKYWRYKLETYDAIVGKTNEFVEKFGNDWLEQQNIDQYQSSLKSEIYYMFFHSSEALFTLMLSFTESLIPPLEMKRIHTSQINKFIKTTIESEDYGVENVKNLYYIVGESQFDDSAEFIYEYIKRVGNRLSQNTVYNEYKHGLRLRAGDSEITFDFGETSEDGESKSMTTSGTAHRYINTERIRSHLHRQNDPNPNWGISENVTEFFDYEVAVDLCFINCLLIRQIIRKQKKVLQIYEDGLVSEDGFIAKDLEYNFNTFGHLDIDDIFEEDIDIARFTIDYKVGPEVYRTTY